MELAGLLKKVDYKQIQGASINGVCVSGIAYDSRKVQEGSLFVCISGAVSDGHAFAKDAVSKGAVVLVTERPVDVPEYVIVIETKDSRVALAELSAAYFGYPANELSVIGITGTKGKTTATYMMRSVLEASGIKTGLIGTIETIISDGDIIPSQNTTPESYIIQQTFRKMADAGCKCVVMEVSSQGLKLHRTDGFIFDYGIFTNLAPDHIGPAEHKDLAEYIYCKSLLFRQCKHGIFNIDDSHVSEILKGHTCDVETYGFSDSADLVASGVEFSGKGGMLGVKYHLSGLAEMDVEISIPGKFSVYNSMIAVAVCRRFGISSDIILKSLLNVHVKGRTELLDVSPKFTVMIDYAHNAMSLKSLLETLKEYNPKRLVCLFGCGGNRSRERRFEMGEVSSALADLTVITSDNPRNEDPVAITNDIETGVKKSGGQYITIINRPDAIRYVIENAMEGDVIVLAGKGHEDYQEIKGKKYHMDERELVADVVRDGNFIK